MTGIAGIDRVAVVGTGTIGASWAALFLAHGLEVAATDPAADAEQTLRSRIAGIWPVLQRLGTIAGPMRTPLRFTRDAADAVRGAQFVQENGPEREDLKRALFAELDRALPPEVIIASSSSGLLMSRLQGVCRHPGRCVIGHPFNPPHLIPLVEVVGGAQTSQATIDRTMAFYAAIGKRPIHIRKEVKGHVANRLQAAMWREAVSLVDEGVASVADVDDAIASGPGLRWALMGPHLTFHLAGGAGGMEHFMAQFSGPIQGWWQDLGAPTLTPELQGKLVSGVAEEARGRSVDELAKSRDERLVILLQALQHGK
jgi:3-hydroxyacyl-CoA dehydrogenase